MIDISYGKDYGDATREYIIKTDNKTVGEFISEWLETRPSEWGEFRIYYDDEIFENLSCEYKYGEIISKPFPKEILELRIARVIGNGGWTNSDFHFLIAKDNSMEVKTMKVNVFRDSTSQCGEKLLIGEFKDVYHPVVFLKSLLDEEEERASQGGFVVEFDFLTEVNENA